MRKLFAVAAVVAAAVAVTQPAGAASKSCTRGGATLEAATKDVRVVRLAVEKQSRHETRREHLLACWVKTGKRTTIAREVDNGDDNRASTRVEVNGRYVGVRQLNMGGVSLGIQAAVYDARTGRKVADSGPCDQISQGDFGGVNEVAFLESGGMAFACDRLHLIRKPGAALETIEPAGTRIRQLAASRHSEGFGQRLYYVAGESTVKSLDLG